MRALGARFLDRFQVPHDLRQVTQPSPETIQLLGGTINGDGFVYTNAMAGVNRRPWTVLSGVDAQGCVDGTASRHASKDEAAANRRQGRPAQRPPRAPVESKGAARNCRGQPL